MATSSSGGGIDYRNIFFAFPNLTLIRGEPNADSLIKLKNEIKANASSVPSNLGGGNYGHLGLVLSPVTYSIVSNDPFVSPLHPGVLAIPPGTTGPMATVLREQYAEFLRAFREVTGVEKAIKQQILKAIEQEWLLAITDRHAQCLQGSIAQILEFLFTTYGHVSVSMLEEKENELRTLNYHPRQPVDVVFNTIDDLVEYATMARQPFSQQQTIAKAYSVFNRTRLFDRAITEWNRKIALQKTWIGLKSHFRDAQRELRASFGSSIAQSELNNTANLIQQVVHGVQEALSPADMGTTDPTVEMLQQVVNSASASTTTQQQLTQQMQQMQAMMQQMQLQLTAHQHTTGTPVQTPAAGGGGRGVAAGGGLRYPRRYNLYCWSHGGCGHKGLPCRAKKPGHQDAATFANKMGGSTMNCPPGNVAPAAGWTPPNASA